VVIDLFDDESDGLIASFTAAADAGTSSTGPLTREDTAVPNTSGDFEFARQLFIKLNREAMGIPSDDSLVVLSSDEDYRASDAGEVEEDTGSDGEDEKGQIDEAPAEQRTSSPSPPPST
jgi:hypothetical protein